MRNFVILLVTAVLIIGIQSEGIRVDNFETIDIAFASDNNPVVVSNTSDSRILGGTRWLTATHLTGVGQGILGIRCAVVNDRFSLNSDNEQTGSCRVDYFGENFAGFMPPLDFSSCDCWLSRFESVDEVGIMARFTAMTVDGGNLTTSINTGGVNFPGVEICPMFVGQRSAYSAVTGVSIELGTTLDSADAALNFTCCAPAVSCWHNIDFLGNGPNSLIIGDTVQLTINCQNYVTRPPRVENIRASLNFPSFGALDSSSLTCTPNSGASIVGNSFTNDLNLNEGEISSCSFNISFVNSGDTGDFFFDILNFNSMAISHSTDGENRAGSVDLCNPAVPSRLIVGGRLPTTLAPTISGDPHFIGFKGQKYDFHGIPDTTFNLITDTNLQLNSYFYHADLRPGKKETYMGKLGLRLCYPEEEQDIRVYFECNREEHDYIVRVNDKDIAFNETLFFGNTLYIRRGLEKDGKTMIKIGYGYHIVVRFSESSHSSCHLNMRTSYAHRKGSPLPHGVLGQSSRRPPGIKGKGWNSPNIVKGDETDYRVKGNDIFGTDFKFNMYKIGSCHGTESYSKDTQDDIDQVYKSYGE